MSARRIVPSRVVHSASRVMVRADVEVVMVG